MKKRALLVVVLTLTLLGCSKLSKENYDKLEMGMTQDEVEKLIGKADSCAKTLGTLSCVWGDEESTHVKVMFMGDKAVTFSYKDL